SRNAVEILVLVTLRDERRCLRPRPPQTTCADCAGGSLRDTTTRRGALGASCIQQRPPPFVSGEIGLRHKASITPRGASGRNLYQGVLQTMALHIAHHMSYRS